jgi:GNAT superfamily N-acetyltransferase
VGALERLGQAAYSAVYRDLAIPVGGGAVALRADVAPDTPMVNRLVGLGEAEPATEETLDAGIAALEGTRFYVGRSPDAGPPELEAWLAARGLARSWGWMQFTLPDDAPAPTATTDLRIEEAGPERAADFARIVRQGYGLPEASEAWLRAAHGAPGWSLWLALDGDEPAAAAGVYLGDEGAYLGFAATLPEHRGKGAQGALLAARIRRARDEGRSPIATETGERVADRPSNSYRNLVRAGFREEHVVENWARADGA